jgi:hypothetical protein
MSFSGCLVRGAVAASTILLLAACTGNGSTGCAAIPNENASFPAITLISPAPGATGVSTGPLDVSIGNAFNVGPIFLKDGSGNVISATAIRQANAPSSDVRIATFAQLASHTTYQVYASVSGLGSPTSPCANTPFLPAPQNVFVGSFTTG